MITRIKGTQDFLDLSVYNWILQKTKKHLIEYNFHEIATPLLEPLELFKRSLGLETDVVSKEMYRVLSDTALNVRQAHDQRADDSENICLRPELTASIMRAFINAGIQETPWKVFSAGPAFRHERPQKGRYRQFHQMSMEIIGSESIMQDALFMAMLDTLFATVLNIKGYALLINYLGTRDDRAEYQKVLKKFLEKHSAELCDLCKQRMNSNIMRVFDCKQQACQKLYTAAPAIIDVMAQESVFEWQQLKNMLEELSVSYSVKPTLVRGLDYYNKTVFEFVSVDSQGLGAQNTFCGGGRYDTLATQIGAKNDYPSIGAAIGLERMQLLLEAQNSLISHNIKPALTVVIPLSFEQQPLALQIVQMLHAEHICADVIVDKGSVKSMFKAADKMGAQHAILIGSEEQASGTATIKNMTTGTEVNVPQRDIITHI
ncbi:MAG: histidine--tRNA ligase [Candidatus Babeliaceae bacterium]|nr:histidine--tRNA ligase [Candidatus Babeliaceae bacterium]